MKKPDIESRKRTEVDLWLLLAIGILSIVGSMIGIWRGSDSFRGFSISPWASWAILIVGAILSFFSARAIVRKRKEPLPMVDIDADAAKAEADLDQMYFKQHGKMPEKPEKE